MNTKIKLFGKAMDEKTVHNNCSGLQSPHSGTSYNDKFCSTTRPLFLLLCVEVLRATTTTTEKSARQEPSYRCWHLLQYHHDMGLRKLKQYIKIKVRRNKKNICSQSEYTKEIGNVYHNVMN